ncbi:MAG: hypothetical protein A2Z95_06035 [Gallionellales bacterium GWA2_60_18]|nr:MAG: hypothetical protein A2Z95_06035 [Gallionellales bacterium GWA2_60_18]
MAWNGEKLLTAIGQSNPRHCITEAHLVELTGLAARQVKQSASTLIGHGLMEKTVRGCLRLTSAGRHAVESGASIHPRRALKDTLRVRVWRAVRLRRKFTVPDIIGLVADDTARGDITSNVQKYICALAKAGYLIELPKREACISPTSPGFKRWWLQDIRDTGPLAPVLYLEKKRVYDPNTDETHDIGDPLPNPLPPAGEGTNVKGIL